MPRQTRDQLEAELKKLKADHEKLRADITRVATDYGNERGLCREMERVLAQIGVDIEVEHEITVSFIWKMRAIDYSQEGYDGAPQDWWAQALGGRFNIDIYHPQVDEDIYVQSFKVEKVEVK